MSEKQRPFMQETLGAPSPTPNVRNGWLKYAPVVVAALALGGCADDELYCEPGEFRETEELVLTPGGLKYQTQVCDNKGEFVDEDCHQKGTCINAPDQPGNQPPPEREVGIEDSGHTSTPDLAYMPYDSGLSPLDVAKQEHANGAHGMFSLPISAWAGGGATFATANRTGGENGWCDGSIQVHSPNPVDVAIYAGPNPQGNNAYEGFGLKDPTVQLNNAPPCYVVVRGQGDVGMFYTVEPLDWSSNSNEDDSGGISTDHQVD
jgi:hypothetical protein